MPAKALLVVAEIVRHTEQPIPRLVDVASLAQCLEHAEEGLLNELVCVNRSGAAEVQVTKNRVIVFFIQLPDLLSGILPAGHGHAPKLEGHLPRRTAAAGPQIHLKSVWPFALKWKTWEARGIQGGWVNIFVGPRVV
ncbi:MAG TPA: hypothetical protein VEV85_27435 [Bryobacteraceae bacterium]|nr:hypothetical protein [Bryobacteraceae bacterium]